ncbi:hypothetical protein BGZ81_002994, partial [Podila clonocystis]
FRFRRDPSRNNEYVCWCGSLYTSYYTLSTHISRRCTDISEKATEISTTKEVCDDKNLPINFWPAEVFAQIQDQDDQEEGMPIDVNEFNQDEENIDDEPRNLGVIVADDASGSGDDDDLMAKEQELKIAIQELSQELNKVKELRNRHRK